MSLNTILRSVGFGQLRSGTGSGGRRRSSSRGAGYSVLPSYARITSSIDSIDERRDGSASPIQLSTRSSDPSKDTTTTDVHEIDIHDTASARTDYLYSVGEARSKHRVPSGRSQTQRMQGGGIYNGQGSDDGHTSESSKPTTSAVLLRPFLSNFTIGYADGLTVPFALTAGLSWLGSSHMVITAGFAEICAGCVSMGIGGYLAADGNRKAEEREAAKEAAAEGFARERLASTANLSISTSAWGDSGSPYEARTDGDWAAIDLVRQYLQPLNLPPSLAAAVYDHATTAGGGTSAQSLLSTAARFVAKNHHDGADETKEAQTSPAASAPVTMSPILCGLSVSVGYLAGGLLPLFPYFFVDQVQHGLIWSFVVCVVALFAFGATKEFVMFVDDISEDYEDLEDYCSPAWDNVIRRPGFMFGSLRQWASRARRVSREDVRSSLWEGWRMAWLGSIAAIVAVLCVMVSQLVLGEPENVNGTPTELLDAILASYGNGTYPDGIFAGYGNGTFVIKV